MKLLTIGIPTFNRAKQLDELLTVLIPACDQLEIEVLVSDNCSTDDTAAVLNKYKYNKCLHYVRNKNNLGFDRNILNLIANASGKFLWWFGDDDNLRVEHLADIKSLLVEHPDSLLFFVNYMHNLPRKKGKSSGTSLKYFTLNAQQHLDRYLHLATLITTNIINVKAAKSLPVNQECIGKGWINLHLLLLLINQINNKNGGVVVIKNPIVIQGMENAKTEMDKWKKTFIDYFAFTLSQTPIQNLSLSKCVKHFYDINIRLKYLNMADIIEMKDPLDFNRKIIEVFRPNIFAQLAFWLQYFISRVLVQANRGRHLLGL